MTSHWKINNAYKCLYNPAWHKRYNVFKGGAGSGKSHALMQYILYTLMGLKKCRWLVVRKVADTIKDSVFQGLLDIINEAGIGHIFKINKTEKSILCINGNLLITKGMDDPEKVKSIVGVTHCFVEEATELDLKDWKQLKIRLRGIGKKFYYLAFNPIDETHWIKAELYDHIDARVNHVNTTYKDNNFLTQDDIDELESYKYRDEYYYKVYCLGEWGSISNARILNNYVITDVKEIEGHEIYQGFDFGYNDPCAFIRCQVYDKNLYIFEEYYESGKTAEDLVSDFNKHKDIARIKRTLTIGDTADPSRIETLRRNGWNIRPAQKGAGSLLAGIDFIKQFNKIYIDRKCKGLAKEVTLYKWTETKTGILRDKPVDAENHSVDSLRYSLEPLRLNLTYKSGISIRDLAI